MCKSSLVVSFFIRRKQMKIIILELGRALTALAAGVVVGVLILWAFLWLVVTSIPME